MGHCFRIKKAEKDTIFSKIMDRDTVFARIKFGTVYSKMGHNIRSSGGRLHVRSILLPLKVQKCAGEAVRGRRRHSVILE